MSDNILKIIIDKVDKLDTKIDTIAGDIVHIKVTSARHDENLKEHMKRSELLEKSQEILFKELKPIKAHINQVIGMLKFVGIFSSVVGGVIAILKFLKIF